MQKIVVMTQVVSSLVNVLLINNMTNKNFKLNKLFIKICVNTNKLLNLLYKTTDCANSKILSIKNINSNLTAYNLYKINLSQIKKIFNK